MSTFRVALKKTVDDSYEIEVGRALADRLAEELQKGQKALYLGSRDFTLPDIPPKSRSGNRITSVVFKLLYGQ